MNRPIPTREIPRQPAHPPTTQMPFIRPVPPPRPREGEYLLLPGDLSPRRRSQRYRRYAPAAFVAFAFLLCLAMIVYAALAVT